MKRLAHRGRMTRRWLGACTRLCMLLMCLALMTTLSVGAAAEQADADALLATLLGRTFCNWGSGGECSAITFCRDGHTIVFTSTGPEEEGMHVRQTSGTIDSATALHEHVLSLHLVDWSTLQDVYIDYETAQRRDVPDDYDYYDTGEDTTLLLALPGADASELDGRRYSMTTAQHNAYVEDDAYSDGYPYESAMLYRADLIYDQDGFQAPFIPYGEAAADWYAPYCDQDPAGEVSSGDADSLPAEAASDAVNLPADSLPAEVYEQTLMRFYDIDAGYTVQFHTDGGFEICSFSEGEVGEPIMGRIDSIRSISPHGYELHIAQVDSDWAANDGFTSGNTIVLLLPHADKSEITGTLCPTFSQDYAGLEAAYEPEQYYIGAMGETGEMLFRPF